MLIYFTAMPGDGKDMRHDLLHSSSGNIPSALSLARDRQAAAIRDALHRAVRCLGQPGTRLLPLMAACVVAYSHGLMLAGVTQTSDVVLLTVFAAAALSSIAGFAFSALCGAVLFHLQLGQVAIVQIMMVCSIGIQAYMVAALWRSIPWRRVVRFLAGGMVGLPVGLLVLLHTGRGTFVMLIGGLLCLYSLYMLLRRPVVLPRWAGRCDALVGFVGGITGGAVAFPGAPVTVWGQMSGWQRDYQRGVYQPYILLMQLLALGCMFWVGAAAPASPALLTAGLAVPPALAGTLIGLGWYRQISDRQFFITVNLLLLFSGVTLIA
jgi:uncharacterized protein